MWDEVLELAMTNGIWALLFCSLLVFELKDSRSREKKYQNTIEKLSNGLDCMHEIGDDIQEIRQEMRAKLDGGI